MAETQNVRTMSLREKGINLTDNENPERNAIQSRFAILAHFRKFQHIVAISRNSHKIIFMNESVKAFIMTIYACCYTVPNCP